MSYISIPKGKQVRFHRDGRPIEGTENAKMILEEDITITMSSSFSPINKGNSSPMFSMLSGLLRDRGMNTVAGWASGQFKQLGFQTWTGTNPLKTTISINLFMENDAYEDVVRPALALAKLCLPMEVAGGALVAPGPAITSAYTGDSESENAEIGKLTTCYLGSYTLRNVIVETAQPTFSKQIDQNGYPISAKVELSITTVFSGTSQMVDEMLGVQS